MSNKNHGISANSCPANAPEGVINVGIICTITMPNGVLNVGNNSISK